MTDQDLTARLAVFQRTEVRRAIHNNEWWFVIVDVIGALTDSVDPSQYLKRIRQRDPQLNEAFKGGVQLVPPLLLTFSTAGGKQKILCWNTEGIFRQNKQTARSGGTVAGNARRDLEKRSGRKVVTSDNYLALTHSAKRSQRLESKTAQKARPKGS